jgi:hypothetical protein
MTNQDLIRAWGEQKQKLESLEGRLIVFLREADRTQAAAERRALLAELKVIQTRFNEITYAFRSRHLPVPPEEELMQVWLFRLLRNIRDWPHVRPSDLPGRFPTPPEP